MPTPKECPACHALVDELVTTCPRCSFTFQPSYAPPPVYGSTPPPSVPGVRPVEVVMYQPPSSGGSENLMWILLGVTSLVLVIVAFAVINMVKGNQANAAFMAESTKWYSEMPGYWITTDLDTSTNTISESKVMAVHITDKEMSVKQGSGVFLKFESAWSDRSAKLSSPIKFEPALAAPFQEENKVYKIRVKTDPNGFSYAVYTIRPGSKPGLCTFTYEVPTETGTPEKGEMTMTKSKVDPTNMLHVYNAQKRYLGFEKGQAYKDEGGTVIGE